MMFQTSFLIGPIDLLVLFLRACLD